MKRFMCVLLVTLTVFLACGCARAESKSPVVPPARIGANGCTATLSDGRYTFESAFESADAVARVKVGDWRGEDESSSVTFFDASVLHRYKGDIPDDFVLVQDGAASCTMTGYPLFTNGNELLVFLKQSEETAGTYRIIGSYTTVMDVSYDSDGVRYYADRFGMLGKTVLGIANHAESTDVSEQVISYVVEKDPIMGVGGRMYEYIFSEADIDGLISNM